MDNQKRLRRKVNSKLRTVLLLMLVAMFVISSVMTVNAATIKDDGKYTLLLTCGLNGPDGKIDGEYSKMIKFDVADGDTTVSLSELTAGILPFNGRTQFAYWATDWTGETRVVEDIPLSDFNSKGTFYIGDSEVEYTNGLTIFAVFSEEALKGTGTYYLTLDGLGGEVNGKYEMTMTSSSNEYQTVDLTQYVPVREGYVRLVNAEIDGSGNITESDKRTGRWAWKHPHKADGTVTYTELKGDITMNGVDFGYVPEKTVLHDVTLYAHPGEKIAFVGATGAGKTTITNLINRFYDIADGKIRYDNININKIAKPDLRRSLGVVLQETNLFTGTVMDKIRSDDAEANIVSDS